MMLTQGGGVGKVILKGIIKGLLRHSIRKEGIAETGSSLGKTLQAVRLRPRIGIRSFP